MTCAHAPQQDTLMQSVVQSGCYDVATVLLHYCGRVLIGGYRCPTGIPGGERADVEVPGSTGHDVESFADAGHGGAAEDPHLQAQRHTAKVRDLACR